MTVHVARDEQGEPCGSEIRHGGLVWLISAWPHRVAAVETLGEGLAVSFRDGRSRLLEVEDAS